MARHRFTARARSGGIQPEAVRIRLLGGFEISVGSRSVEDNEWRLKKARDLIKLLALTPGHRLHRNQVMAALWPDLDQRSATNNLHRALHFARAALEPDAENATTPRFLSLQEDLLALYPDGPLWVDVDAFEESATAAGRTRDPAAYRAAIELYAGDLLPENRYEDWAEGRREALRETYLALLTGLAEVHEERKDYGSAVEALRRVLYGEPAHEEAHRALMRLYAGSGERRRALAQYERLEETLSEDLDAEPSPATRRLHEEILANRYRPRSEGRPPKGRAKPRHNLPNPRTSFVGREKEIVGVKRYLAMTGVLTLTGMGGCGKTRLALEVARDLVGAYADGVWLVELAPLSDPTLVPSAVAEALGVREQPGLPLTKTLAVHLGSKRTLVVLDNCEHLIEASARLVDALLNTCPGLGVLATSREALGVPGETNWLLPPLALPDAGQRLPPIEELARCESIRLFLERARSRLPDFELKGENARGVVEVCRKLDGIPLGIELATARMGALALDQVVERLNDSLRLLTVSARTAEPRHQTLRATLEWSYDLLDESERRLFERLSVFAGGLTLEAAEAVCSGEGIEQDDVLDLLSRLVDKSLVVAEEQQEGAFRYRMLEPIRQFGHERLEESGETERVRERHARYFLRFAEGSDPAEAAERQVIDARPIEWVRLMEGEHANLGVALDWSLGDAAGASAAEVGPRLAVALFWFWHAHHSEGRRRLERAARRRSGPATARWRARASHGASWFALYQMDPAGSKTLVEGAVALYREAGDEEGLAIGLVHLGMVAVLGGRDDIPLRAVLEELGERRSEIKNRGTLGYLLMLEGLLALSRGDFELSAALHEESLQLLREIGDTQGMISALINLGGIALARGDHEGAVPMVREALLLGRDTDMTSAVQHCLYGLACVAADRACPVRAARLWGAVEGIRDAHGLHLTPVALSLTGYEGRLAAARQAIGEEAFVAAWEEGKAMPPEQAIEYALSDEGTEQPARTIRKSESGRSDEPTSSLTRRERQVATLIGRGFSNRRISEELGISERTVEGHVGGVLRKLGLRSRTQIAAWITRHNPGSS